VPSHGALHTKAVPEVPSPHQRGVFSSPACPRKLPATTPVHVANTTKRNDNSQQR